MRAHEIIPETFSAGKFPNRSFDPTQFVKTATKIKQVSSAFGLWKNTDGYFGLVKDDTHLAGFIKISDLEIAGTIYSHCDLIYVLPEFQKNGVVLKYLIYVAKEELPHKLVADGAIYDDGGDLIQSIVRHHLMRVSTLNKVTGEITPFNDLDHDYDSCYLFERAGTGYGKQYLPEMAYTWYQLFND